MRGALLRRHVNQAVEEALVAFCGTRGPKPSDEALWASFAWHCGYDTLRELANQGLSEIRQHKEDVAPAERPRILQKLLSDVWNERFPKAKATGVSLPQGASAEGGAA